MITTNATTATPKITNTTTATSLTTKATNATTAAPITTATLMAMYVITCSTTLNKSNRMVLLSKVSDITWPTFTLT